MRARRRYSPLQPNAVCCDVIFSHLDISILGMAITYLEHHETCSKASLEGQAKMRWKVRKGF